MARDEAISAIETALKLLEAVRAKLREVVALKVIRGQDESFDRAEVGDALVTGGLDVLKTGLATARDLRKKVTT